MKTPLPIINIKAQANHHAIFLILSGWILLLVTLLISQYYWQPFRLPLMFLILTSLVFMVIGFAKYLQPKFSYQLTPKKIEYRHIHGKWKLAWQQIQAINPIREVYGLNTIDLPYIGIRLVNLEVLAQQISPRLANRLIYEQQPLIKFALVQQSLSLEQVEINFSPYTLQSGSTISGPIGVFLHHCQSLKSALGYHLYLPETTMDRELNDFHKLLKQCQLASQEYG